MASGEMMSKKHKAKPQLRSRNRFIDFNLGLEDNPVDSYADLEDFVDDSTWEPKQPSSE